MTDFTSVEPSVRWSGPTDSSDIRILHVDDDKSFAKLCADQLQRIDARFKITTVSKVSAAMQVLAKQDFDCIVSDYDMPDTDGIEFLKLVRGENKELPVILFTGKGSEEVASEAIAAGVTDYLQKGGGLERYELLANRITNAVQQYRARHQAEQINRIRRVLRDVNQALIRSTDRDQINHHVCRVLSESVPYRFAWIGSYDPEAKVVYLQESVGHHNGYLNEITTNETPSHTTVGPSVRAAINQEPIFVQDIHDDDRFQLHDQLALDRGYRSIAAIPLVHKESVYGVINVYADRTNAFDPLEQELLRELADDIAYSYHIMDLRNRHRRARQVMENLPVGVFSARDDRNGSLREANSEFREIVGIGPSEQLSDFSLAKIVADPDGLAEIRKRLNEEGEIVDAEIRLKVSEDESRWFSLTAIKSVIDAEPYIEGSIRDIHHRHDRDRYHTICNRSPDAIILADETGEITFANDRVEDLLGYSPAKLEGELVETLVPKELRSEHIDHRKRFIENPEVRQMGADLELTASRKDGSTIPVDISLSYIHQLGSLEVMATIRDIRDRVNLRNKHRTILQAVPDAVLIADRSTGELLEANPQATTLLGYDKEELIGKDQREIHPAEDRERYRSLFKASSTDSPVIVRAFPDGSNVYVETNDGDRIPVEINAQAFAHNGDEYVVGIFRDISERMAYERELEVSRNRLSSMLDAIPIPLGLADFSTGKPIVKWVNAEFEDVFGTTRSRLEGTTFDMHIVPTSEEDQATTINKQLSHGEPIHQEVERETADGERRTFLLVATPLQGTGSDEVIGAYVDITEQRRLLQKRKLLSDVSQVMGTADGFVDGLKLLVESICEHTEWSYGEVWIPDGERQRLTFAGGHTRNSDFEAFIDESEELTFNFGQGLPGRVYASRSSEWREDVASEDQEVFIRTQLASQVSLHAAFGVPVISDGSVLAVIVFFLDQPRTADNWLVEDIEDVISNLDGLVAKKQAEDLMKRRNQQLEQFAGVISHDLKNPLNVAKGYTDLLQAELEDNRFGRISDALERMEELIEDLLTLARQGRRIDQKSPVDIAECVERCWRNVDTENADIRVTTDHVIMADRQRFEQLVENLISNAIEHGGQSVSIEIGRFEGGYYIEDDGPGISEEQLEEIFVPGYTSSDGGAGFGLAIVREIVEAHGWTIKATNSTTGGARFEITGVQRT